MSEMRKQGTAEALPPGTQEARDRPVGPAPADWAGLPAGAGGAALGAMLAEHSSEVSEEVLARWLRRCSRPSQALREEILRFTELGSGSLAAFLRTGQLVGEEQRPEVVAPGAVPLREPIGLDEGAKLYLTWRDVVCNAFRAWAPGLGIAERDLEAALAAARSGCDRALVGVLRNFESERRRLATQLVHSSLHDSLTGLPNRALLVDRLEQLSASAARSGQSFAVLFVDLDRFSAVNDLAGHTAGDAVLSAVARRLKGVLREGDTLARLGGDEFVILCPGLAKVSPGPHALAERVIAVMSQPFGIAAQEFSVTASVGITVVSAGDSAEQALSRAESAMCRAKRAGGSAACVFDGAADRATKRRLRVLKDFATAQEREELHLAYQPVVRSASGEVATMEALLRWSHSDLGRVPPSEFIPLAEESGTILPVGRWVLKQALADCAAWRRSGMVEVGVSVNVSGRQLGDRGLLGFLARLLEENGLDPPAVTVEITESTLVADSARTRRMLSQLKDVGVRLAIDDFGTGYSSLAYLRQLPIDAVKVDRSFVSGRAGVSRDATLLSAMVDLAHRLDLVVVAEGVETPLELEVTREVGCDEVQGYLLGRPARLASLLPGQPGRWGGVWPP